MSILVGIDGTSGDTFGFNTQSRNEEYDAVFANSFVKRICGPSGQANTMYLRGPGFSPTANGLVQAILKGFNFIRSRQLQGIDEPILLTGYSRGAAGVIAIAHKLRMLNILPGHRGDVKAMLLFDCVNRDMQIGYSTDTIPDNVGHVLHVMRSDASGSRPSFGHSGTQPSVGTDYIPKYFTCTHGAMGGTPWPMGPGNKPNDLIVEGYGAFGVPENFSFSEFSRQFYNTLPSNYTGKPTNVTYAQDAKGAEQVQSYVKPFMREQGFPIPSDIPYSRSCFTGSGGWANILKQLRQDVPVGP